MIEPPCSSRTILHIDMDAFYASIEQRDNPSFRGKPVIVGAKPGTRGVVSAASYEARTFGIHSAMPISQAHGRCPNGIYVRPHMERYARESHEVMAILAQYSPELEQISVDEAFLDITGTRKLWGPPRQVAQSIAQAIRSRRGLTASIGIAPNKFLAKIASDFNKPNGITEVPFEPEKIAEWLAPMPVNRIWGVGKKTEAMLKRMGMSTIGDLQQTSREYLRETFGKGGEMLYSLCRGIDNRPVGEREEVKTVSREHTFNTDTADREALRKKLLALAHDIARRARRKDLKGRTVVLSYRSDDFNKHSRRTMLAAPTNTGREIFTHALELLDSLPRGKRFRLIGVGLANLGENAQTSLFDTEEQPERWEGTERAGDMIRKKFGDGAIYFAGER